MKFTAFKAGDVALQAVRVAKPGASAQLGFLNVHGQHNSICKTANCYKPTTVIKCILCGLGADRLRHVEKFRIKLTIRHLI